MSDNYILVIDPDTDELRKLREILTKEGYSIMTAIDRATALHICERIPIRFVLAKTSVLGYPNGALDS
jgi:PleD family two-component response regulator